VAAHRITPRTLEISCELARRIHQAHMIACPTDTNDGETSDDQCDRDSDY